MSHGMTYLKTALRKSPYSAEVSHANRIAVQENALRLVMSVISGESLQESFAKLNPDGCWERMYQGCSQVRMEGFSDEFLETWPTQGIMRDGECFQPSMWGGVTNASEYSLLPTPLASDEIAWKKTRKYDVLHTIWKEFNRPEASIRVIQMLQCLGYSATQSADFTEMMMGFPPHWTDLNATETL